MEGIKSTLSSKNIQLSNMLCLSRDNPNVMKRVFKLLEELVKQSNNPKLVDAPCFLHPTHTAFKQGAKALLGDIMSLLGNLHGYFKTSTARRADMVEVREELAETLQDQFEEVLDQFFLRHVDTRWLESASCLDRLLKHWDSTVEYFMVYLPNSPMQNNKKAVKSKKYKKIASQLCQEEEVKTKIRVKFLVLVAQTTQTFLTLLQSQKPMIHQLQELAFDMFSRLSNMVIKVEKRPTKASKVKTLDLSDSSVLLTSKECGFLACCSQDVAMLTSEDRQEMRRELRESVLATLKYMQTNLPWDKPLYEQLSFMDPMKRTASETVTNGVAVAVFLNRFTQPEQVHLSVLLGQYQALPPAEVPSYSKTGRVDHWWVKIFNIMTNINKERPKELEHLVKMCCTLAHGNAFLERGMGLTKRVVVGRSSLSHTSVKAQKVVKQAIVQCGGVDKVPITSEMLVFVKGASREYSNELQKEKDTAAMEAKDAEKEAEAAKKRKLEAQSIKTWQEKKDTLAEEIHSSQVFISGQEAIRNKAMEQALKQTNPSSMKTSMRTAKFAAEAAEVRGKVLNEKHEELARHMGKKPRGK